MKRRNRFLIGMAAAAITFGSLFAFVGPDHWAYRHHHAYGHGCHHEQGAEGTDTGQEVDGW